MTFISPFSADAVQPVKSIISDIATLLPVRPTLPQRILLLSDIHANWPALEAVLRHAQGEYDIIWFLGDVVGYGPFPVECVSFIKQFLSDDQWRAGNHDLGVLDRMEGFRWSGPALYTQGLHWEALGNVPLLWEWMHETMTLDRCGPMSRFFGKGQQILTHANLENDICDPNGYLFPANTEKTRSNVWKLREFLPVKDDVGWLLAGHSHIPCLFHISPLETDYSQARPCSIRWGEPTPVDTGHYYINPGSVGQPRDGDPRASYVILDMEALTATWQRVEYDLDAVTERMYQLYKNPHRNQLLQFLKSGGTAKTIVEMLPFYRIEKEGLIVT